MKVVHLGFGTVGEGLKKESREMAGRGILSLARDRLPEFRIVLSDTKVQRKNVFVGIRHFDDFRQDYATFARNAIGERTDICVIHVATGGGSGILGVRATEVTKERSDYVRLRLYIDEGAFADVKTEPYIKRVINTYVLLNVLSRELSANDRLGVDIFLMPNLLKLFPGRGYSEVDRQTIMVDRLLRSADSNALCGISLEDLEVYRCRTFSLKTVLARQDPQVLVGRLRDEADQLHNSLFFNQKYLKLLDEPVPPRMLSDYIVLLCGEINLIDRAAKQIGKETVGDYKPLPEVMEGTKAEVEQELALGAVTPYTHEVRNSEYIYILGVHPIDDDAFALFLRYVREQVNEMFNEWEKWRSDPAKAPCSLRTYILDKMLKMAHYNTLREIKDDGIL